MPYNYRERIRLAPTWRRKLRISARRFTHNLLHGALVIAPFAITIAAVHWLFVRLDNILRPLVGIPGLGFLAMILLVAAVGWLTSFFIVERLFELFDRWLERTPGIQFLYTSVRDFFEAFAGNKARFQRTVLVNVLADEVWMIGFLTDESLQKLHLGEPFVSVYVPQAYNVAGQLYVVKRERVRLVENISPADAMKYAVTGGAAEIVSAKDEKTENTLTKPQAKKVA